MSWSNWAGNQVATPVAVEHPQTEDELAAIVRYAADRQQTVKPIGSGHSFTDIGVTTGRQVMFDRFNKVIEIDPAARTATVQAGITLKQLNQELDRRGLALPNLGDIDYQTVSGAISTSTHGTGRALGGLATFVQSARVVTGEGNVVELTADDLHLGVVGLGALGLVSQYTLRVVPSFHLRVTNQPMKVDRVLGELNDHVENNDHFEFFWVPHTKWALTKTNNRTTDALKPRSKRQELLSDYAFENAAFGVACRIGRLRPSLIPRLATSVPSSGTVNYVDKSYRVFVSPRLVKFVEMEYSIPYEACAEALNRIRDFIDRERLLISFPVEVRFTSGDDLALSTASGAGRRCYIAVHVYKGTDESKYFRGVEAIMNDYGGRPHWGKMHYQTADTLAPRYHRWNDVLRLRDRLDPNRVFANAYSTRALGA